MDFMTKLETNALRIAELIGLPTTPSNTYVFEQYNGLMPIMFESNKSDIDYPITINPYQVKAYPCDEIDIYGYNTEPEFIEALQLACIKYLELKNDNSRVQQTI